MTALKNQRGQSTVEYILIIAIAVAIVLGGIYQLNSATRIWADNYFGDYLTCLLETGELPTLGGTSGSAECNVQPFNLKDGFSPLPPGGGGPNGGDGDDPSDAIAGNGSRDGGGGGGGNAEGEGSGGRMGAPGFAKSGTRTRIRSSGGEGDEDKNESMGAAGSAYKDGYDNTKVTRFPVRNLRGVSGGRGRLEDKEDKRTKVTTTSKDSSSAAGRPERMKVRTISSTIIPEEEGMDLSFGNLLRYLIIIIIIIAIVVFLGGQALQVSKNS